MTYRPFHPVLLRRLARAARAWRRRAGDRRLLATFDERMLHDIGLCGDAARTEIRKPPWRD